MQKIKFFLGLWAAKFLMLIYKIIGNIPAVKNISNKICVMDKR